MVGGEVRAKRVREKRAEWRWRLRRFSPLGVVSGAVALLLLAVLLFAAIPSRIVLAPEPELLELAESALRQGDYARAYPWLRAAFERPVSHPEVERPAQLNPEVAVTRAELAAGYEGLAARDLLLGDAKARDYRDLVWRALAESPERGSRLVELLRDSQVAPVLERALAHQLMEPSLRAIARTAAQLEPIDRRRLAERARLLQQQQDDAEPRTVGQSHREPLAVAEVERRLRAIFAFVRDSVAVLPQRGLAGMRYPADTLYQGSGRVNEVNWLLLELMRLVFDTGEAHPAELVLAPGPLVPLPPFVSPEISAFAHEMGVELFDDATTKVRDLGVPRHEGANELAVILVQSDAGPRLYAFDVYAGVPLLDESGALLDLFQFFAGSAAVHPELRERLSYSRHRERLTNSRLRLVANPIRASWIGARLHQLGLDVAPFPGPSPLTMALEPRLRDDQGQWFEQSIDIFGPPPHQRDRRVELTARLDQSRQDGEIAEPRAMRDVYGFPYRWRWQPVHRWWIVEALRAELEGPRVPNDAAQQGQHIAQNDNITHRLRALDYRRPGDATARLESVAVTVYQVDELRDRFLFPPEPEAYNNGEQRQHMHYSGIPVSICGSPMVAVADALRRLLPATSDWTRAAVRSTQGRVGVALGNYWSGQWELAALSFDDYTAAMRAERTSESTARYPGKWRYLAWFTRGRALHALNRPEQADEAFRHIPPGAPLGVAAALPHLLRPPTPYHDDQSPPQSSTKSSTE